MAAEITRRDIITDEALKAPQVLAENLKAPIKVIGDLLKQFRDLSKTIKEATNVTQLKNETVKFTQAQSELDKVNKQIAINMQKNTEEYLKQQRVLSRLKQDIKDKIALDGRDAQEVNKLNASVKVLSAALDKNRRDFSALTTEQERNSASGLKLANIIQQQSNELDELRTKQGQYNQRVGQYEKGILDAYNKINQLNKANKELLALQGKLTQSTAEERQQYQQLTLAIQNNVQQINQYNTVIARTGNTLKGVATQILSSLGLVGAIFIVIQAIKDFINVNKEFETSLSKLSALTGATGKDLEFYKEQAIAIGAATKNSAKDIAEAFRLIGGARPDLLENKEALAEVTEAAAVLANASGLTLPEAADALAGALNQLQLPAEQAARVINVMAKAAQAGAAEIPDLNASLKQFGAVLKGVNGTVEEGAALIEVLADRQIKGAEAGTALRNVLLAVAAVEVLPRSAQAQLRKFGVDINFVKDNTKPLNERLRELSKIAGDASALVKVFGKENFVAGNIVLNNVEKFEKLTEAVTGTNSAYEQASTTLDNLEGDQRAALAATEALALEYGGRTQNVLRGIVQTYTTFINLLREAPKFIEENKTSLAALGIAILAFNGKAITANALVLRSIALDKAKAISAKSAAIATQGFFRVLTATIGPLGLILLAVAGVVAALAILEKTSKRTQEIERQTIGINQDLKVALDQVKKAREEINITVDDFLKKSPEEQKALRETVVLRKKEALAMLEFILARKEKLKDDAKELTLMQQMSLAAQSSPTFGGAVPGQFEQLRQLQEKLKKDIQDKNAAVIDEQFAAQIDALKLEIEGLDDFIKNTGKAIDEEAAEQGAKEKENAIKLRRFRVEQAIKTQEEIRDNQRKGDDERLAAVKKIESLRGKLASIQLEEDLAKTKITQSEQVLAYEKYQAALTDAAKLGTREREQLLREATEADRKYAEAVIKGNIQANQNVLANDKATLEERNAASLAITEQKLLLLEINKRREIDAAEGSSKEILRIEREFVNESKQLTNELNADRQKNFFAVFEKGFENVDKQAEASRQQLLKNLNEMFQEGEITVKDFLKRRENIEKASNDELLRLELEYVKRYLEIQKALGHDTTELQRQVAEIEFQISESSTDRLVAEEQRKADLIKQLKESLINFGLTLVANATQKEIDSANRELANLKTKYEREVELAGDNEKRKAQLRRTFERQEDAIQARRRAAQRRQALIEKTVAAARAAVNTARAVTEVLPNIPLSLIIAALGAVEVGTILATPIPQFKYGGKTTTPEFIAGEAGSELMQYPGGYFDMTPEKATRMKAPVGTVIYDNKKTIKMLAQAVMQPTDLQMNIERHGSEQVVEAIEDLRKEVKQSNKSGGDKTVSYMKSAAALYEVKQENDNFKSIVHSFTLLNEGK